MQTDEEFRARIESYREEFGKHFEPGAYPSFGLGWDDLVKRTLRIMLRLDPSVTIIDSKEKMGTLSLQVRSRDADVTWLALNASIASMSICEVCGRHTGRLRQVGNTWVTRCDRDEQEAV